MLLAEVVGTVVARSLSDWLVDPTFQLVEIVGPNGKRGGAPLIVALDPIGVAPGEMVLVSQGSSVRQTDGTKDRPVDALIAGVVDLVEQGGKYVYRKDG